MAILKSEAKLTEPFVGKKEVIVMLSVQDGQSTASATKLDYDAVHALEQMIIDLTFTADTPQTDCETCKYGQDKHRYAHICNECGVGINNYTPQTESQNSNKNSNVTLVDDEVGAAVRCAMCSNPNKSDRGCDGACSYDEKLYERIMKAIVESTADTPQPDCEACELDGKAEVCKICRVSNYEPQPECPWK